MALHESSNEIYKYIEKRVSQVDNLSSKLFVEFAKVLVFWRHLTQETQG